MMGGVITTGWQAAFWVRPSGWLWRAAPQIKVLGGSAVLSPATYRRGGLICMVTSHAKECAHIGDSRDSWLTCIHDTSYSTLSWLSLFWLCHLFACLLTPFNISSWKLCLWFYNSISVMNKYYRFVGKGGGGGGQDQYHSANQLVA